MQYDILYNTSDTITIWHDTMIIDQADRTQYTKTITVSDWASLRYCLVGDASHIDITIIHQDTRCTSIITGLCFAHANAPDSYKIHSVLANTDTSTDINITTLLYEGAHSVVDGMITIQQGADQASGYLHEKNIVLGNQVSIKTLPQLDIHHHNVSAGHGATIDTLNDHSMFYMMSKGISKHIALQLILHGIVEKSFEWYHDSDALSQLKKDLIGRMTSYHIG